MRKNISRILNQLHEPNVIGNMLIGVNGSREARDKVMGPTSREVSSGNKGPGGRGS